MRLPTTLVALALLLPTVARGAEVERPPFKLLYSNDTTNLIGCVSPFRPGKGEFTDDLLRRGIDEAVGADAQMLQPGCAWIPWWRSKQYPAEEHYRYYEKTYGIKPNTYGKYMLAGGDMVKTFVEYCRSRGVAPFVSVRLNDAHGLEAVGTGTAMAANTVSRFYEQHYLEWRLGPNQKRAEDHVLNWAVPEVPAYKLGFIRELCENYDLAGVELDFLRFPSYFREGETTPAQRRLIMTEFVRAVRRELDRTHAERHRYLCVRVPAVLDGPDARGVDRFGLDYPELAAAGVEMFNCSFYYTTQQRSDLRQIRRLVPGAAVYLEMTNTTYTAKSARRLRFVRLPPNDGAAVLHDRRPGVRGGGGRGELV